MKNEQIISNWLPYTGAGAAKIAKFLECDVKDVVYISSTSKEVNNKSAFNSAYKDLLVLYAKKIIKDYRVCYFKDHILVLTINTEFNGRTYEVLDYNVFVKAGTSPELISQISY